MDLFNMRYSTNTVGEHPTEIQENASVSIFKLNIFAEINVCPDKPALPQDLNDTVLKAIGLV